MLCLKKFELILFNRGVTLKFDAIIFVEILTWKSWLFTILITFRSRIIIVKDVS